MLANLSKGILTTVEGLEGFWGFDGQKFGADLGSEQEEGEEVCFG